MCYDKTQRNRDLDRIYLAYFLCFLRLVGLFFKHLDSFWEGTVSSATPIPFSAIFPIVSSSDFYFTFDSVLFCRRKIKLSEIELDFLFASSLFELPKKRPGTLILFVILGGLYSVSLMLRKPYTPLSLHCLVMYWASLKRNLGLVIPSINVL